MPDPQTSAQAQTPMRDDSLSELPPRPRRRVFGKGANPVVLSLLATLLIACGFIAGVLIEKGQSSPGSGAGGAPAGLAARLAALRGQTGAGTPGSGAGDAASTAGSPFRRTPTASSGATVGEVAYLDGSTLYMTNAEGNTIKVSAAPGASVTRTVKAKITEIRPGETIVVSGAPGANGSISAVTIRAGTGGGALAGGGLAALLGARGGGSPSTSAGGSPTGGGEPALFGKG